MGAWLLSWIELDKSERSMNEQFNRLQHYSLQDNQNHIILRLNCKCILNVGNGSPSSSVTKVKEYIC